MIFILAFLLAGTFTDYKEAERIPGELAASVKTLYRDTKIISTNTETHEAHIRDNHIKQLLNAINLNFGNNVWKQTEVNSAMDTIDNDIIELAKKGTPQVRNELSNIERISHRIEIIKETTFVPAAYNVAELAIGMGILTLLFSAIDPYYEGLFLVGVISVLLISIILLIKDMDDPFDTGKKSYVDIDLSPVYKLEEYLQNK